MECNKNDFIQFKKKDDRVDKFLWKYISETAKYDSLGKIFKLLLFLSHGQAQVEHRFSISNVLVENPHKDEIHHIKMLCIKMGSR